MRLAMIIPRPARETLGPMEKFSPAIPPLGPLMVATRLKGEGHEIRLIDAHALRLSVEDLLKEIRSESVDVALFSCLTFAMDGVEETSRLIRETLPSVKIVLGNLHATLFHEDLVGRGVGDAVVRGEGEETICDLIKAWSKGLTPAGTRGVTWRDSNGTVVVEEDRPLIPDLTLLPHPNLELLPDAPYEAFRIRELEQGSIVAPIQAGRGCAFNCAFCSQNIIYPGLRLRRVDDVLDEMEAQSRQHDVRTFGFVDANFPPSIRYGHEFARKFRERGLVGKISWFTEVRLDLVDAELISDLAGAGCRLIQFGVESGDDAILNEMGKGTEAKSGLDVFRWCREAGIMTVGLFVIGMPGETEAQIRTTVKLAARLDPDLAKFSVATPYPGSALWHEHQELLKDAPYWKFSGWLDPQKGGPHLLEGVSLPSQKLARWQRMAMVRFYGNPRVLARLVRTGLLRPGTLWQGIVSAGQGLLTWRGRRR